MNRNLVLASFSLVLGAGCTLPDPIEEERAPPESLEYSTFYTGGDDGAGDLLAPVVTMRHDDGRVVTLIGLIHLGDAAFYDAVNAECAKADRVLTEGVVGSPSLGVFMLMTNTVFTMQRRFAHHMGFPAQGDTFEDGPRHENGDVALADWQAWQPWWTPITQALLTPILIVVVEVANLEIWAGDVLTTLTFTNRAYELRVRQFYGSLLATPDDDDDSDALLPGVLGHRNDVLLSRVDEEFQDESVRTIALPWGAAHLRGLVAGLKTRGFTQSEFRWQRAWSIKSALDGEAEEKPTAFYVPWVVFYKSFREARTFALAFDSIVWNSRATGAWRFNLLWDLLYTQGGHATRDASDFRIGPLLFGRPLLLERVADEGDAKWRFLLFGSFGAT